MKDRVLSLIGFVYCPECDMTIKVKENHGYTKNGLKSQRLKARIIIGKRELKDLIRSTKSTSCPQKEGSVSE